VAPKSVCENHEPIKTKIFKLTLFYRLYILQNQEIFALHFFIGIKNNADTLMIFGKHVAIGLSQYKLLQLPAATQGTENGPGSYRGYQCPDQKN